MYEWMSIGAGVEIAFNKHKDALGWIDYRTFKYYVKGMGDEQPKPAEIQTDEDFKQYVEVLLRLEGS